MRFKLLLLFLISFSTYAQQYTNIPDQNFENLLITLGIDSEEPDGKILTSAIASLTSLNVSNSSITELTGIEDFVALTYLSCNDNQLTTLDVSKNVALTNLNCWSNQLTTLDVSKNVALTDLNCDDNQLTTLGFSENVALTYLSCWSNQLTTLDVSKNVALTYLGCDNNQLTTLDVSKNVALTDFDCDYNQLTMLDISKNVALTNLNCHHNLLTTLDTSKNVALTDLGCYNNQLTTLDTSKNIALTDLGCWSNQLTTLSLSENVALTYLSCWSNQLTTLDVSKNVALTYLNCSSNQLTTLDVSKSLALIDLSCGSNQLTTLDISKNVALTDLSCWSNQLTTLDVSKNAALTYLSCPSNQLISLNLKNGNNNNISSINFKNNPDLPCVLVDNVAYSIANWAKAKNATIDYSSESCTYTPIPNQNFENKLIALGIDSGTSDGKVLTSAIASLTSLNVSNSSITELTGIEYFVTLTDLNCSSNQLTTLDVSKNVALTDLNCSSNQLTTLSLSENVDLTDLSCSANQLTTLDVSKNLALTGLSCSSNQLTTLSLSENIDLIDLNCSSNQLTTLSLSENIDLIDLNCSSNQLTTLSLSENVALTNLSCSSNQLTTLDVSKNVALIDLDCGSNQLTTLDVSKNVTLIDLDCGSNQLISLNLKNGNNNNFDSNSINFKNNPNLSCLLVDNITYSSINWENAKDVTVNYTSSEDCIYTTIPDQNFENKLIALGIDSGTSDGKVLTSAIASLTSLNVSNSSITELTGIEDFVALRYLDCGSNQLISLNLKNGNNNNLDSNSINFKNNPNLSCILVDDVAYSNTNWKNAKDTTAYYNDVKCPLLLSSNNFTVVSKGESCAEQGNGEISITAEATYNYVTIINENTYSFNNSLKVSNIAPGTYAISITIEGEVFEQKFTVVIPEGVNISGKSNIVNNKMEVEIAEGTPPYTVFIDNKEQYKTTASRFSVALKAGKILRVKTAKVCEGVYTQEIEKLENAVVAYPNPTSGSFEIELTTTKKEILIALHTIEGQLISSKTYPVKNGAVQLTLENQSIGIYVAKINLNKPKYLKIIKK